MGIFYDLISESPLFNHDMAIGYSHNEIQIFLVYMTLISAIWCMSIFMISGGALARHKMAISI